MYKGSYTISCTNLRIHAFLNFISKKVILDGSRPLYSCYVYKTEYIVDLVFLLLGKRVVTTPFIERHFPVYFGFYLEI